jgi:MFS transporter, DHA3 family, macrolide efflux protein
MSIPSTSQPYQAPPNGFRTFVIIWITQTISVIGSALTIFSVTIWLTEVMYPHPEQKAQLAFALSANGIVWGITHILAAPFAGAWADRHDRKKTMIVCDLLNCVLSLALVALILSGMLHLWLLLLVMALSTIVSDFHGSSFDTSYVMLVPEKQLTRANGMMQTSWSLSSVLSPAIAATLIALPALARQGHIAGPLAPMLARISEGTPLAISVDALTFFLAALTPLFLFVPSPVRDDLGPGAKNRKSLLADIREGALFIWRRRPMLWLLATFTAANLLFSFMSMLRPMIVKFNLVADWTAGGFTYETALALVSSALGVGGLVGGLIMSTWGGLKSRRVYGVIIFMILAALSQVMFGLANTLYIAAVASALWSAIVPFMNAHSAAIWQAQTPRELQGRVFSVRRVIAQFTYPIGTALAGIAGGIFNPGIVIAVAGVLLLIFCIGQLVNPYLLHIEDKAYMDELAARAAGPVSASPAE